MVFLLSSFIRIEESVCGKLNNVVFLSDKALKDSSFPLLPFKYVGSMALFQ